MPFLGHRENSNGQESGSSFLNITQLIARHSALLQTHFTDEKSGNKYLSSTTQKEILALLANSVPKNLITEINYAPFSLDFFTTQGVSKQDQLSIVVRYVNVDLHKTDGPELQIKGSFLGFKCTITQDSTFEK
jgi:hypothetical protein